MLGTTYFICDTTILTAESVAVIWCTRISRMWHVCDPQLATLHYKLETWTEQKVNLPSFIHLT